MISLFLARLFITTVVVVLTAHLIPGLIIKNLHDAIFFGLILGLINAFIRPIITFLTLPVNLLTLGLFSLVINGFTFWLASKISYGVYITSFWGAFWGGAIIWITGIVTNRLIWSSEL